MLMEITSLFWWSFQVICSENIEMWNEYRYTACEVLWDRPCA